MDRPLLPALALLAACGGPPGPSFVTRAGVQVTLGDHARFLTRAQADEMDDYALDELPKAGYPAPAARSCLSQAQVEVVDQGYRCYGDRACAGEQYDEVLMVADVGCAFSSAYIHEEAHWIQQCVRDVYDPEHREAPVWQRVAAFHRDCDPD